MLNFDLNDEIFADDFDCAERLQWWNDWEPAVDPEFDALYERLEPGFAAESYAFIG